ncbi:MAG: DegT/DnrJ/EryC1/StrS family aminotransferase [Bacteroidales bacterium]
MKYIWLSTPHMSGREMKYIEGAFHKNQIFPNGSNIDGFEKDLKTVTGAGFVSCLSSGTAAIHLALIVLGVEQGDEVICSSFTFSASANPIVYLKATPVFIDSEPATPAFSGAGSGTWNMSPMLLESAIIDRIKKGKRPKAIIAVHLYGMPARMDEIMEIANRYEIPVIEDAAEAIGSKFNGQACGTIGEIGILSFNGNKTITTSAGGALISNKKKYCDQASFLSTQARDDYPHYEHTEIGYNYRMSNICAGIGRGQIEVIKERVGKRRENFFFYKEALKDLHGINFLEEPDERFFSNHWLTAILVDPEKTGGVTREHIRLEFEKLKIESRPLWKPMHLQPVFKECPAYVDGTSERLFNLGLCLPSSTCITDEERSFVAESLYDMINGSRRDA